MQRRQRLKPGRKLSPRAYGDLVSDDAQKRAADRADELIDRQDALHRKEPATEVESEVDLSSHAERAQRAGERIKQLRQRRRELASEAKPSTDSVVQAHHHAQEAMERAENAHLAAAAEHERAALIHERTANTLQQAAIDGADNPRALQDQADEHWQAAEDNREDAAQALEEAEHPDKSSSGSS